MIVSEMAGLGWFWLSFIPFEKISCTPVWLSDITGKIAISISKAHKEGRMNTSGLNHSSGENSNCYKGGLRKVEYPRLSIKDNRTYKIKEEDELRIKNLVTFGLSVGEIADVLGVSYSCIYRRLQTEEWRRERNQKSQQYKRQKMKADPYYKARANLQSKLSQERRKDIQGDKMKEFINYNNRKQYYEK